MGQEIIDNHSELLSLIPKKFRHSFITSLPVPQQESATIYQQWVLVAVDVPRLERSNLTAVWLSDLSPYKLLILKFVLFVFTQNHNVK